MSSSIFFPVQPMIFDPPSNPEEYARFDFLLPSYYGVNRCLSTRLDFQLQVVNTGSSYNPETISPVWFDYESPVLYMVKPVFITTRYGLSSTGTV